jgi:hypothetical protein
MKFRAAARLSAIGVSRLDRPAAFAANPPATGHVAVASAATALRGRDLSAPVVRRTIDVAAGRWAAPEALGHPGMTPTVASVRNGLVGLFGGRASGTAVTVHNASISRRQVRAAGVEGTVHVMADPCATRATGVIVRHGPTGGSCPGLIVAIGVIVRHGPTGGSGPGLIVAIGVSVRHGPTGKRVQEEIAARGVILPAGLFRHEATVLTVPIGVSVRHGRSVQEEIAARGVILPAGLSRHEVTVPTVLTAHGASGPGGHATPESPADVLPTGVRTSTAEGGRPVIDTTANARTSKAVRVPVG